MRRRIALYGGSDEALQLVPLLQANPAVEIVAVYDPNAEALRHRVASLDLESVATLERALTDDPETLRRDPDLYAVVDAGLQPSFASRFPDLLRRGVQVVAPLTARLLWGYGVSARDRKAELLQALHEVVESVELTVDADELFSRMLEIAIGVTGADRGSLMLLDPESEELTVRVAIGIESELWPKIRVRVGEGIVGRVAADGRPLRLRGKADREAFQIVRERLDVESALCVPLLHEQRLLGVLNLHHTTRPDVFSDDDLAFAEQLGRLDAQIIARAQEHELLRGQAARYEAVREVRNILAGRTPLHDRIGGLCDWLAGRVGSGVVSVYLFDPEAEELRLAATSLEGGGLGGEYRVRLGQGLDGRAARQRRPLFLREPDGRVAYAALPLLADDTLVGLLAVQSGERAPRGPAAEEGLLEIAAATADGIAQAERESRITTHATKEGALNEAGIRMISSHDVGDVARLATSSAGMVLEADHAVLRLQDEATRRYVVRSYFGSADGRLQERLFRLDKQVSVDVIKRRGPMLVRDARQDSRWADDNLHIRSFMAAPLLNKDRIIGILAVYEKVTSDRFAATTFVDDDFRMFVRFASYVERAVENSRFRSQASRHRSFDEETGLPTTAYLGRRIDEEIARAAERLHGLALVTCRLENLEEIRRAADPIRAERVVFRIADALRTQLRDFDVLARTGEGEFTVLMPEPGAAPEEAVAKLARAVADDIAKDDALNEPVRVGLAFGYAVHPDDGVDRDGMLARASSPRIRML